MKVNIVYNRRKEKESGSVEVQVFINKKERKYIATGVKVPEKQWDFKNQRVKNHKTLEAENLKITNLLDKVNDWYKQCLATDTEPTMNGLTLALGKKTSKITLNEYFKVQLEIDRPAIAVATFKKRTYVIDRFDKFGEFLPHSFDIEALMKYNSFLLGYMANHSTTNHHKIIDLYLKRALRAGIIKKNPYEDFKKPRPKRSITYLTVQELNRIRQYRGVPRVEKIRDLFLFQCLTGMAYCDMQGLLSTDVQQGTQPFIIKNRSKTEAVPQMVPLLPEAMEIINKYSGHSYCLPRISNQKLNAYLRELADICHIDKPLTSHVGRHTFATLMLERGLPLETISHILGHASTDTTKIYARLLMSKIEKDLNRLNISSL